MSIPIVAIEYVNNVPTSVHYWPIAAEGDNDYRAIGSFNSFDKTQAKQCMKDCKARRFWPLRPHEVSSMKRMDQAMAKFGRPPLIEGLPETHHHDIWAFYKAVGYDHKAKTLAPAKD